MNILIAPDSFKGTYSAKEIANFIEEGILKTQPNAKVTKIPIADGGEGSIDAISDIAQIKNFEVSGPLNKKVNANIAILKDTAVIEMAQCAGLSLIKQSERNPMLTSTYGLGELIINALDLNIRKFIICIGGSCTNDCGAGMANALGVKFFDKHNNLIQNLNGGSLKDISSLDLSNLDKRIKDSEFMVACDVKNPLYGKDGAAYVYAKQKGATDKQIELLDQYSKNFSNLIKDQLGIDINYSGCGAAGGLGGGLVAFTNAKLTSGIQLFIDLTKLEQHLKETDLIITGEGCLDSQTLTGKVAMGISILAKEYNKKIIAVCGKIIKNPNIFDEIVNVSDNNDNNIPKTRELIIKKVSELINKLHLEVN